MTWERFEMAAETQAGVSTRRLRVMRWRRPRAWLACTTSMAERSQLIEAACRAAAVLLRNRAAAGATPVRPILWPPSTWEFLRRHATRVRTESTR